MLPIGAVVAAVFGILLGAPTLRLRGDYLAIVTLGFGEIVPIVFRERLASGPTAPSGIGGIHRRSIPASTATRWPTLLRRHSPCPYYLTMAVLITW